MHLVTIQCISFIGFLSNFGINTETRFKAEGSVTVQGGRIAMRCNGSCAKISQAYPVQITLKMSVIRQMVDEPESVCHPVLKSSKDLRYADPLQSDRQFPDLSQSLHQRPSL